MQTATRTPVNTLVFEDVDVVSGVDAEEVVDSGRSVLSRMSEEIGGGMRTAHVYRM
jgi:hypothetical protein